jgi:hypothetical protein
MYWMGSTDAPSLSRLVTAHRSYLRSGGDAAATTTRVLNRIFGDNPYKAPSSMPDYSRYLSSITGGSTYDEVLAAAVNDYVRQAFSAIFRVRNDLGYSRPSAAVPYNDSVRVAVLNMIKGVGPRPYVSLPDGRPAVPVDAESIWTYVAESAAVWGSHRGTHTNSENCVGGIGPKCKGAYPGTPVKPVVQWGFTRMDGLPMHYVQMLNAIGSILHDRACLRQTTTYKVVYCSGQTPPLDFTAEFPGFKEATDGTNEWRKAVYNTRDRRYFYYMHGPYPVPGSENPAASPLSTGGMTAGSLADYYEDDIRTVANRATNLSSWLGAGVGVLDQVYTRGETKATSIQYAPRGTPLDTSDAAFCMSGAFSGYAVPGTWGTCS